MHLRVEEPSVDEVVEYVQAEGDEGRDDGRDPGVLDRDVRPINLRRHVAGVDRPADGIHRLRGVDREGAEIAVRREPLSQLLAEFERLPVTRAKKKLGAPERSGGEEEDRGR